MYLIKKFQSKMKANVSVFTTLRKRNWHINIKIRNGSHQTLYFFFFSLFLTFFSLFLYICWNFLFGLSNTLFIAILRYWGPCCCTYFTTVLLLFTSLTASWLPTFVRPIGKWETVVVVCLSLQISQSSYEVCQSFFTDHFLQKRCKDQNINQSCRQSYNINFSYRKTVRTHIFLLLNIEKF